jgi:small-conductance mechanosensitive channel
MFLGSELDLGSWLDGLGRSSWVRQMGILLGMTLLSWPIARLLARRIGESAEEERLEIALLRVLTRASAWPVVALALSAVVLEVWRAVAPASLGENSGVLPTLVFFLVWRLINTLLLELMPKGPVRRRIRRVLVPLLFVLLVLQQIGLLGPLVDVLQRPLVVAGDARLTVFAVLLAVGVVTGASVLARLVHALVGHALLPRLGVEVPVAEAIATVARYALIVLGALWALEILGFDLTTLKIAFGALGIGIGFGLQNIVNNFTSGLILLFERSVKRGDVLTVDGTDGRVQRIGLRSSVIRTRGGDDLIVPNSILVENKVTNYNYGDELKRVDIDVGVSYASDPQTVRELLLEVGRRSARALEDPPPSVLFLAFGESSLDFQLRVWIADAWKHPVVRSELHFDVWYALKEAGIEIPFPQRDLHVRSGELPIRSVQERPADS